MAKDSISPEDFVRAYMRAYKEGKTIKELSETLDITDRTVYTRVSAYRRKGVKLPQLAGTQPKVNVESLNRLIQGESINGQNSN